jgi:hypothetical protein
MLWLAVLIRILCCLIPATTAFCLLPRGGPSDAVSDFQADIVSQAARRTAQRAGNGSSGEGNLSGTTYRSSSPVMQVDGSGSGGAMEPAAVEDAKE